MIAPDKGCIGATVEATGNSYRNDAKGFLNVDNPTDAKRLREIGYVSAGHTPKARRYFVCDPCNFETWLNHCPKCDSTDLRRVES